MPTGEYVHLSSPSLSSPERGLLMPNMAVFRQERCHVIIISQPLNDPGVKRGSCSWRTRRAIRSRRLRSISVK
jgi:hypothetical protein